MRRRPYQRPGPDRGPGSGPPDYLVDGIGGPISCLDLPAEKRFAACATRAPGATSFRPWKRRRRFASASGQALPAVIGGIAILDRGPRDQGLDRRSADRQGPSAARRRPGGTLGGALDARPDAADVAAAASERGGESVLHRSRRLPRRRPRRGAGSGPRQRRRSAAAANRISRGGRLPAAAGQGHRSRRARSVPARGGTPGAPPGRRLRDRRGIAAGRGRGGDAGPGKWRGLRGPARLPQRRGHAPGRRRRLRPHGGGGRAVRGHPLTAVSGFQLPILRGRPSSSAQHPLPVLVAPPATRFFAALPSSTSGRPRPYGWLSANAGRFGFSSATPGSPGTSRLLYAAAGPGAAPCSRGQPSAGDGQPSGPPKPRRIPR